MLQVSEDQRVALVEFITHLTLEDWVGVTNDLVTLGFMPEGLPPGADVANEMAPLMQKVMGQLVRGGGLRNGINVFSVSWAGRNGSGRCTCRTSGWVGPRSSMCPVIISPAWLALCFVVTLHSCPVHRPRSGPLVHDYACIYSLTAIGSGQQGHSGQQLHHVCTQHHNVALTHPSLLAQLTHELEHVAKAYSVVVPPYFTLVLRAFSTIEGVHMGDAATRRSRDWS